MLRDAMRRVDTDPAAAQIMLEEAARLAERIHSPALHQMIREVLSRNCELAMPHHRMKNPQEIEIEPPEASIPITGVHI